MSSSPTTVGGGGVECGGEASSSANAPMGEIPASAFTSIETVDPKERSTWLGLVAVGGDKVGQGGELFSSPNAPSGELGGSTSPSPWRRNAQAIGSNGPLLSSGKSNSVIGLPGRFLGTRWKGFSSSKLPASGSLMQWLSEVVGPGVRPRVVSRVASFKVSAGVAGALIRRGSARK